MLVLKTRDGEVYNKMMNWDMATSVGPSEEHL